MSGGRLDWRTDGGTDGGTDGRMDGWMDDRWLIDGRKTVANELWFEERFDG